MAEVESFFGKPALRNRLLADVEAAGLLSRLWLNPTTSASVFELLGSEHHVDRALLKLLAVLAGSNLDETSGAFLANALTALPIDRPSDGIAVRWLLDVCAPAVALRLAGTAGAEPMDTIVALLRRSCDEVVDEGEWRSARRAMMAVVEGLTTLQAIYADVAMAMTWDLRRYPLAIADVFEEWEKSIREEVYLADGWTQKHRSDFYQMSNEARQKVAVAMQERSDAGEELTPEDQPRLLQEYFEAQGKLDVFLRVNERRDEVIAATDAWHAQRQSEYLLFAGAVTVQ